MGGRGDEENKSSAERLMIESAKGILLRPVLQDYGGQVAHGVELKAESSGKFTQYKKC
jgi:hypothetical protein